MREGRRKGVNRVGSGHERGQETDRERERDLLLGTALNSAVAPCVGALDRIVS